MPILETKGLVKDFGGLRALDNITLRVEEGEIFGLIGPNGSGKTTMLNVISGFLPPTEGDIVYKNASIAGMKPYHIADQKLIRTFQVTSVFTNLTVEDNILHASHLRTNGTFWGSLFHTPGYRREEERLKQKITDILEFTELSDKRDAVSTNLGAGEQRDLEVAVALAAEPDLLLLDEPAAGMNPEEQAKLMRLIQSVRDRGITVMVIEHNMKVIMGICTRIMCLNFGATIAEGSPQEIASNETVIAAYLGGRSA